MDKLRPLGPPHTLHFACDILPERTALRPFFCILCTQKLCPEKTCNKFQQKTQYCLLQIDSQFSCLVLLDGNKITLSSLDGNHTLCSFMLCRKSTLFDVEYNISVTLSTTFAGFWHSLGLCLWTMNITYVPWCVADNCTKLFTLLDLFCLDPFCITQLPKKLKFMMDKQCSAVDMKKKQELNDLTEWSLMIGGRGSLMVNPR